ncbi:hypothetical protein ARALYDRAFT_896818 [Arabidopsis lyrata subsp. lyrata]|uniref:Uncharacterized protein n=1 Tax=Arabidopsis lyrata subsp. lyrata TaxID=81972 RepID=D7L5Z3_ARALL|nr:hypothetical protein ARALYDRAFT_896818 [Arabidopsis lyrata subsp. lyrata]
MSRRIPTNLSILSVRYQVNFEFFYLIGSIKSNLRCVIYLIFQFSPETATVAPPPPPVPQYISSDSPKIRNFWFPSTIIMTFATSILTRI